MTDILKDNIKHFFVVTICFILDRLTKFFVIENNIENMAISDYLNINLIWNTGIGFGLLRLEPNITYHLFSAFIFCIILFVIIIGLKEQNLNRYGYALIVGGAVGNLYDRITLFAVPDFIDLHYKNFHWFTFNIADIFVTIGILILIVLEISKVRK